MNNKSVETDPQQSFSSDSISETSPKSHQKSPEDSDVQVVSEVIRTKPTDSPGVVTYSSDKVPALQHRPNAISPKPSTCLISNPNPTSVTTPNQTVNVNPTTGVHVPASTIFKGCSSSNSLPISALVVCHNPNSPGVSAKPTSRPDFRSVKIAPSKTGTDSSSNRCSVSNVESTVLRVFTPKPFQTTFKNAFNEGKKFVLVAFPKAGKSTVCAMSIAAKVKNARLSNGILKPLILVICQSISGSYDVRPFF